MKTASKREQNRQREQRKKKQTYAVIGVAALVVVGVITAILWQSAKTQPVGEAVSVPPDYINHVAVGTPLSYPSDPPAGGPHYGNTFERGFYDETSLPNQPGDPQGYLVHNLEHGYVIFWYNCAKLDENACKDLKTGIKTLMDSKNNNKLIAFPWKSIDSPLVMTSWGRLQRFDKFDERLARAFIDANLNKSPEPDAQ
ncbi:MAG TPA: DUF3105 domain-containing protein [Anaerolineales bacterium]|jgi:hypothetical protein